MNDVSKSIRWSQFSWNPVKGVCPNMKCSIRKQCYALGMYKRFKWNPKLRLDEKELLAPTKRKKPTKIFVGSTIELLHPAIPIEWIIKILNIYEQCPQHTFMFLSKLPQRYLLLNPPDNVWFGVTINRQEDVWRAKVLAEAKAKVKFISFEPLYEKIDIDLEPFQWIILGGESGHSPKPAHFEGAKHLIQRAAVFGTAVFLKDNIGQLWQSQMRREFPERR